MLLLTCNIFININDFYKILTVFTLLKYAHILLCHLSVNDTLISLLF